MNYILFKYIKKKIKLLNLSSTEYHIHKSLKIGKIFKIKFAGLAIANSKILF